MTDEELVIAMVLATGVTLSSGENVKLSLRPHPLAFARYSALAAVYFITAFFLQAIFTVLEEARFDVALGLLGFGELVIFWLLLVLPSLAVGVLWVSKQPLVYAVFVGIMGTILVAYFGMTPGLTLPGLLAGAAVLAVILVEFYRRGHRYVVTNRRVVLSKRFLSRTSRELHYSRISEVVLIQGLVGRLFNFGTVIPVSISGMGLGEDTAGAGAGVGLTRGGVVVGGGVFGSKGVSVPRAATYYSLYGVPGADHVAGVISEFIHASEEAPILTEIRDLMKEGTKPKLGPEPAPREEEREEIEQEA